MKHHHKHVFLLQVQRLRVHAQTDYVRKFIKEYFSPSYFKFWRVHHHIYLKSEWTSVEERSRESGSDCFLWFFCVLSSTWAFFLTSSCRDTLFIIYSGKNLKKSYNYVHVKRYPHCEVVNSLNLYVYSRNKENLIWIMCIC